MSLYPINDNILKISLISLLVILLGELGLVFFSSIKKSNLIPVTQNYNVAALITSPAPKSVEVEGKIIAFVQAKGTTKTKNYLQIEIDRETDKSIAVPFDEESLKITRIYDLEGKLTSYEDLKTGQNIRLKSIYNPNKQAISSYEITLLKDSE